MNTRSKKINSKISQPSEEELKLESDNEDFYDRTSDEDLKIFQRRSQKMVSQDLLLPK